MFIRAVPEAGLPRLRMSDGPLGLRTTGPSTAYAAGVALAASWDPDLAQRIGGSIGRDARARGIHFVLGPGVNIYRVPLNGRNFEYFGEDPFLAARLAVAYIRGVQGQGVIATVKHYAANNMEEDRHGVDAVIDERTLRELYLPAFEAAVTEAGVGAVMNSYNLVNGVHASQNSLLNMQILKGEWGFRGILMSDWNSTYDGVAAANAGLDLEMPSGKLMSLQTLTAAVKAGRVSEATIDEKVRRILRTALEFKFADRPQQDESIPLYDQNSRAVALRSAEESIVLLKNEGGILPLAPAKSRRIAVVGPDAYPAFPGGGGSALVAPVAPVGIMSGLSDALGSQSIVTYSKGVRDFDEVARDILWTANAEGSLRGFTVESYNTRDFRGTPQRSVVERLDQWKESPGDVTAPKVLSRRILGFFKATKAGEYLFSVNTDSFAVCSLTVNGKRVLDQYKQLARHTPRIAAVTLEAGQAASVHFDYIPTPGNITANFGVAAADELVDPAAVRLAAVAETVVVSVGFEPHSEGEGLDRSFGLPAGQDALIRAVEAVNPRTIVVLTAGGSVDASGWIDRTPVLLDGFYGGQEAGRALARVLQGSVNPGGHLPFSFERHLEDNPASRSYHEPAEGTSVPYAEGLFLGYRHYDRAGVKPLFPFGFGLSYTTFAFSKLSVARTGTAGEYTVSFNVRNTGSRPGSDVAQVYVGDPSATVERPLHELKGFSRVELAPGETKRVELPLNRRAFAYWDINTHSWRVDPGRFTVHVGDSSSNLPLRADLDVPPAAPTPHLFSIETSSR